MRPDSRIGKLDRLDRLGRSGRSLLLPVLSLALLALLLFSPSLSAQQGYSAYISSGGSWIPAPTSDTLGAVTYVPPAVALYCYNSSTKQWVPATATCFGGGSGTFTQLFGDATSTVTGGATTVTGLNGTNLASLASGFLFNTTGTGVPSSIASTGSGNVVLATSATLTTPTLASPTLSGTVTTPITGSTQCLHVNSSGTLSGTGSDCGAGGSTAFSSLTSGTNTTAAMVVGTGASLGVTGSGTVQATSITALSGLPTQATDTVVMNAGGTVVAPTAVSLAALGGTNSCAGAANALTYNSSTHAWGCNTISGSGTVNSGTANHVAYYASSTTAVSSDTTLTDDGTTMTYSGTGGIAASAGPISSTGPAGKAGMVSLVGNTANQTVPTNQFAWGGFTVTNATAYGLQPSNTAPSGTQVQTFGTPTSGWSQGTWANFTLAGMSSTFSSPLSLSTNTVTCPTCVTSAASLTSGAIMTGAGSQASQTNTTGTGVITALGVNTGSAGAMGVLLATGTAAMNTAAVASGACETVVTVAATGVATTDVIEVGFNGDPTAVTGYGASATGAVLTIYPYPTAGNVNFKVCNSTANSITPGALTLNWKVYR